MWVEAVVSDQTHLQLLGREWAKAQRSVLAFIGSLVNDFSEAEELLQETAAEIFAHVERYDKSRPFLPFAFGVAKIVVLRHHQLRSRRERLIFDQDVIDKLSVSFNELAREESLLVEALRHCLDRLPRRSLQVCRLRYEEGLSSQEIADKTGISTGGVRILLFRVREQLKECIQRHFDIEGERT